jgi:hypothetical protein
MDASTAAMLTQLLSEIASRVSESHAKLAALEITLQQYQPEFATAYAETLAELRTDPPFSLPLATFEDLCGALIRGR